MRLGSEPQFSEISDLCSTFCIEKDVSEEHNTDRLFYTQTFVVGKVDGISTVHMK